MEKLKVSLPFLQGLFQGWKFFVSSRALGWKVTALSQSSYREEVRSGTNFLSQETLSQQCHPDSWSPHLEYGGQRLLLSFINEESEIKHAGEWR